LAHFPRASHLSPCAAALQERRPRSAVALHEFLARAASTCEPKLAAVANASAAALVLQRCSVIATSPVSMPSPSRPSPTFDGGPGMPVLAYPSHQEACLRGRSPSISPRPPPPWPLLATRPRPLDTGSGGALQRPLLRGDHATDGPLVSGGHPGVSGRPAGRDRIHRVDDTCRTLLVLGR